MPVAPVPFTGRHRLLAPDGAELEPAADATLDVVEDALSVNPKGQAALRLDFSDVDTLTPKNHLLELALSGGERAELSMLGRRFDEFTRNLTDALRGYQAKNLLLEESVGGESFTADVVSGDESGPAQVRVYATGLAVLPDKGTPHAVPFGEITNVEFNPAKYAVELTVGERKVSIARLGRQTQEFSDLVQKRLGELRNRNQQALQYLLPKVSSLKLRRVALLLSDGVPARRGALEELEPGVWDALVEAAATEELRPSLETLSSLSMADEIAIGIKETNFLQDAEGLGTDEEGEGNNASSDETPMSGRVVWFLFPIVGADRTKPGNAIALEVVSRGGRATYFFRAMPAEQYRSASADELVTAVRERIRVLSRALVALHFKREPVYLEEKRLREPRYARYRLALRMLPPLKIARGAFLGRAIHDAHWKEHVDAALLKGLG